MSERRRRIGVYGWGVVAPRCANIAAFTRRLEQAESWLTPFQGFGPSNFLAGEPDFDLGSYRDWIEERFPPARYQQIRRKMGHPAQYAIGAFIQSLEQNPGIEQVLQHLGTAAHVYIGSGLGDLPTVFEQSLRYQAGWLEWCRFWASPERNVALRDHLEGEQEGREGAATDVPSRDTDGDEAWIRYWTEHSKELVGYLSELKAIEGRSVEGDIASGASATIKRKQVQSRELRKKWGAPEAPWDCVSANVLWNIHNTPSAQISMLGKITGMAFAPVAACSTFGYALKLAMNSIELGQAKAVVVGASDPPPHPLSVGTFVGARVLSADGEVSKPMTGLRGTHIAGGSCVWILGDHEYMTERGFEPIGMELLGIGVSADADHIITPSSSGPIAAIEEALADAGVEASSLGTWDLHATATPGDYAEVQNLRRVTDGPLLMTARKGTFGHGMGVSGGWELLAQYLGCELGKVFPTVLSRDELNSEIAQVEKSFSYDDGEEFPAGNAGKLSMGVGGVNACVVSRPWK